MGNKRDIKVFIVPAMIILVFLFGIIGYRQLLGPDFSLPGALYCTLFYFVLNNVTPGDVTNNIFLLVARYLAAITLGFGIYSLLYRHMYSQYIRMKIKLGYRRHVVVFSMKMAGAEFLEDLLVNNYQVILIEDNTETVSHEKIRKKGVVVLAAGQFSTRLFDTLKLQETRACVIAYDDDDRNIELSLKIVNYLKGKESGHPVRILSHISKRDNLDVLRDHIGSAGENIELETFNIYSAAAKKIYDQYAPHTYFRFGATEDNNAIAVIGYNAAAEAFIIENLVLSHYRGCENIKIYVVDKDADHLLNHFMYEYPYYREFVELIPVKLLNNKFFANFNWSKELIEKLSKVKAAYFFGDQGAELINMAIRFRQFLSAQRENYLEAPIVICYPEDTSIMSLLDAESAHNTHLSDQFLQQMNISFVNMISDTCTAARLLEESEYIDSLSRVINYYYSVRYEFAAVLKEHWKTEGADAIADRAGERMLELANDHRQHTEKSVEDAVLHVIAEATGKHRQDLARKLGVKKRWELLSYNNKSANRYTARHLPVKLSIMNQLGAMPLSRQNIMSAYPDIAPVEHKRWSAEKMSLNYRYGSLPQDKATKEMMKERLKLHDQLIPYEKLNEKEREKDLNIFLLIPLLSSLKLEIKK